jgi:acetaldehyde dehydrogenase (acetylating)
MPLVSAVSRVVDVPNAEIVASAAYVSAGPGTSGHPETCGKMGR